MAPIRALLAQARVLASRADASYPLLRAAVTESNMLETAGLHELAAEVAREGLATAREHGLSRTFGAVLACNLAEPLMSLGRWDEAREIAEGALQLFPRSPACRGGQAGGLRARAARSPSHVHRRSVQRRPCPG